MSSYDPEQIRKLRDEAQSKSVELQEEIEKKKEQVIALEERVKVYNEFLKGDLPTGAEHVVEQSSEDSEKKNRAPRSTKAEMAKRKDILIHIFSTHGFMQPKEILTEIPAQLGYELEQHHLRAVLKRFPEVFTQDPERHGYWGLLNPPESESDSDSGSTT
jgi:hypothetical protein